MLPSVVVHAEPSHCGCAALCDIRNSSGAAEVICKRRPESAGIQDDVKKS
jgi:hypothetical protein